MNQLKNFCFKAFHFLTIKKEERVVAYTILLLILFLNGLLVWHYHDTLTLFSDDYHKMFRNGFNVSGFDAWTYTVISKWSATQYNIFRHPLLAVFMYIPWARISPRLTSMGSPATKDYQGGPTHEGPRQ